MSLREYILHDLETINNPKLLQQFYDYIQTIKKDIEKKSNKDKVLQFAGLLNYKQANSISNSINENFNNEW